MSGRVEWLDEICGFSRQTTSDTTSQQVQVCKHGASFHSSNLKDAARSRELLGGEFNHSLATPGTHQDQKETKRMDRDRMMRRTTPALTEVPGDEHDWDLDQILLIALSDRVQSVPPIAFKMSRGAFIVIEGLDRSGKSTQSARLLERLQATSKPVQLLKFPGNR